MERRQFIDRLKTGAASAALVSLGGTARCGRPRKESREAGPAAAGEAPAPRTTADAPVETAALGVRDPRIVVYLGAIGRNLDRVRKRAKVPVMGVVKANAYGHGLVEVGRFLESAGVAALMTGKLDEAARLRAAGVRCRGSASRGGT